MSALAPFDVLALNSGSSSLKFSFFRIDSNGAEELLRDQLEATPPETPASDVCLSKNEQMRQIAHRLEVLGLKPNAIGQRIVHGGPKLRFHCKIDAAVIAELEHAKALAPLHSADAIALIDSAYEHFPEAVQVACFDTSFHNSLPVHVRTLPIGGLDAFPAIQHYGFHGLSVESIVHQLGENLPSRVVVAHIGQGVSVTALRDGVSIDTSMSMTPGSGMMMGTRSGDIDPGVVLFLLREGLDAQKLEQRFNQESGLLGVSQLSADMRALHLLAESYPRAKLAIEMFCYQLRQRIAGMICGLEGIDLLVFTGGIGEHDAKIRDTVSHGLRFAGVNPEKVRVMATDEARQMAWHVVHTLQQAPPALD